MTSSRSARVAFFAAAMVCAVPCGHALADTNQPLDAASARDLLKRGRELKKSGDLRGALEKFKAAYALAPTPVITFELARTDAELVFLVEARELCLQIARMPVASDETHLSADARAGAAKLAEELAPRIPSIVIHLGGLSPASTPLAIVLVDGKLIPHEAVAEPSKVDPGLHVVIAKLRDGDESRAEVTVAESETKDVYVTLKDEPVPPKQTPGNVVPPQPPQTPRTEPVTPPKPTGNALARAGFIVAGAGAAIGAVTGLLAFSKASSLHNDPACAGTSCAPSAYGDLDTGRTMGTVSTIAFGIGAAGALVGIYALVTGSNTAPQPPPSTARVSLWVSATTAGIHGSF